MIPRTRARSGCLAALLPGALGILIPAPTFAMPGDGNDLLPDIPLGLRSVVLHEVADIGSDIVIDITSASDGSDRLFLVSPHGVVRILKDGEVLPTPFLDAPASPTDRAMSGLTFHPDFASNGKLYVITGEATPNGSTPHYSAPQNDASSAFDNVLYEYRVSATDPDEVDPSTRRELLRVHQAHRLHNMNDLCFGGDGYLYVAMGDGGTTRSGSPTDYNTTAAQTTNPFGSVLRIDPDSVGTNGRYGIPAGNPFADGAAGNVPEIFAWGLRNPWRISADRATGEIYTGVNGDFTIEQIYRVRAGENYGWDTREGSFLWDPSDGEATEDPSPDPALTPPLAEYDHNAETEAFGSAIGGYVYRGAAMPQFHGTYLFLDWVAAELIAMDIGTGALEIVTVDAGGAPLIPSLDICWGEDEDGELYIGRANGEVLKLTADATPAPRPTVREPGARLLANVPNPFRDRTRIELELDSELEVTVAVFDVAGRRVATLRPGRLRPGRHSLAWNGRSDAGRPVAPGMYTYEVRAGAWTGSGKLTRID